MDRTFRTSTSTSLVRALAIGGVLLTGFEATGFGSTAFAAETPVAQDAAEADRVRMVGDFLHYVLIAKPDLAEAAGQKLFASGITDAELADVVSEGDLDDKVERSLRRGRGFAGL